MEKMLNPRSIAIIGASDKKGKIGNILIKNIKNKKYKGAIFPINPRHKIIEGLRVYQSVLEVDEKIDLAVIAIPAPFVLSAVEECNDKEIKNIIIISAGFSESGSKGKKIEEELKKIAEKNKLNILGPNCLGFINNTKNINVSFAKKEISQGNIGLISQSGAFVTGLLDIAREEDLGFSKIITLGNKTVLDEIDFLNYLAKDSETKIIGLYLENIKRGRLFYNTVAKISAKKPVLILKAGNSEKVQEAIISHTGAMAGEIETMKKVFKETGALYFENMANFWQTLKLFNNHKIFQNNNLVILTNAGGPGVLTADLIEQKKNLNFYNFSSQEKKGIKNKLPGASSVENPVDILGDADSKRYEDVLNELIKIKKIGAVLTLITPQAQTDVDNILKIIKTKEVRSNFPIIPILIGAKKRNVFQFPREVIEALEKISDYVELKKIDKASKKEQEKDGFLSPFKFKNLAEKVKKSGREVFFYDEACDLMKHYGIKSLKAEIIKDDSQYSDFEKKLIMKIDDPNILHKAAQGGVIAGIKNKIDFEKGLKQLNKKFRGQKIIVQKQVEKGVEIIIGLKKDPSFGPVLLCGIGGILTEIIDEKNLWILPVDKKEIAKDLKETKLFKIFEKEGLNFNSLIDEIYKVGKIGWHNAWLKELDINPMFFYQDSKNPLAVDVKVKIDREE